MVGRDLSKSVQVDASPVSSYSLSLSFEGVELPPIKDVMIIGKDCKQGPECMARCLNLLDPGKFESVLVDEGAVHAILVSKSLLKRLPQTAIVNLLRERVFPYIMPYETIRVDFSVTMKVENIKLRLED